MAGLERPLCAIVCLVGSLLLLVAASCSIRQDSRIQTSQGGQDDQVEQSATSSGNPYDYYGRQATATVANPFCRACHLDFDDEHLAVTHETAGIGCERCHGESLPHRSDEANVTPPDLMWPKERINPMCMMCHPRHEIEDVTAHDAVLETAASIFEMEPTEQKAKAYCMDCHGRTHRMQTRHVRWDKCTGEIIE